MAWSLSLPEATIILHSQNESPRERHTLKTIILDGTEGDRVVIVVESAGESKLPRLGGRGREHRKGRRSLAGFKGTG